VRISRRERGGGDGWILLLLIVIAFLIITLSFREGDSGPITSARRGLHAVLAPVGQAGEVITSPFRTFTGWVGDLTVSRDELETLRDQNTQLRQRVAELEEARLENDRLRELVDFVQSRELDSLGARVIGKPSTSWEGVITIDRGGDEGVDIGMPVLAASGLIGQVIETTASSSRVRLLTDQRSGVGAMLQSTRAEGVVRGSVTGDLTLDFVSRETTVTVGDVVLTSGMGGVYPKGLLIGDVAEVRLEEADLFPQIRVRPAATVARLEEVVVLLSSPQDTPGGGGE
jgi:rod shape-determining protein MreC